MAMLKYPVQENISVLVVATVSEQQKISMLCAWIVTNNLYLNNYKFADKRFVLLGMKRRKNGKIQENRRNSGL